MTKKKKKKDKQKQVSPKKQKYKDLQKGKDKRIEESKKVTVPVLDEKFKQNNEKTIDQYFKQKKREAKK